MDSDTDTGFSAIPNPIACGWTDGREIGQGKDRLRLTMSAAAATVIINRAHAERRGVVRPLTPRDFEGEKLYTEAVDPSVEYVNLRSALHELQNMASVKGFWLYAMYFAFFLGLHYYRFDLEQGQATIDWYNQAIHDDYDLSASDDNGWCLGGFDLDCFTPFEEVGDDEGLETFVKSDLSRYIKGVYNYCPSCEIGARWLPPRPRLLLLLLRLQLLSLRPLLGAPLVGAAPRAGCCSGGAAPLGVPCLARMPGLPPAALRGRVRVVRACGRLRAGSMELLPAAWGAGAGLSRSAGDGLSRSRSTLRRGPGALLLLGSCRVLGCALS
jgi:hypothetical protein